MKRIFATAALAVALISFTGVAEAGRQVCNTYGGRTVCTYTPTCQMIWDGSGRQVRVCG